MKENPEGEVIPLPPRAKGITDKLRQMKVGRCKTFLGSSAAGMHSIAHSIGMKIAVRSSKDGKNGKTVRVWRLS